MAIDNLGKKHITPAQVTAFDAGLDAVYAVALAITQNLTNEDHVKYGSIDEKNKLLVNAVQDWSITQPTLRTNDVDWVEFAADNTDRKFADARLDRINTIMRMLEDFKIVHDYDNYQDSLTDYRFTQYKSSTNVPGFTEKADYLKQFFGE